MLRRLLAPVVLALAFPLFLSAQSQATTGIIRGVVTDPAGTPVAGATVVLHELQTGFQRQLITNRPLYRKFSNADRHWCYNLYL